MSKMDELQLLVTSLKRLDDALIDAFDVVEYHMQQREFEVGAETSISTGGALSWGKNEQGKWVLGIRTPAAPQQRIAIDKVSRSTRIAAALALENLLNVMVTTARSMRFEMEQANSSMQRNVAILTEGQPPKPSTDDDMEEDRPY